MHRTLALALAAAACGSRAPAPAAPPSNTPSEGLPEAPAVAGDYHAPHSVMMVCEGSADGWCQQPVDDTMTIVETADGHLEVTVELVQTNGHTCSFSGPFGVVRGATTRRWTHHSVDELHEMCALTLEQTGRELRLESKGCRSYCGARASLDATFPYPPR